MTSRAPSSTLRHPIALAYLDTALSGPGTEIVVDVRGRQLPAHVVALPFYRRRAPVRLAPGNLTFGA